MDRDRKNQARAVPAAALVTLALSAALLLAGSPAEAGNRATYLIGGRAAGMAGAFTALADDGSAAWYNPAALSLSDRNSFDLSASAYGLEFVHIDGMVRTVLSGITNDADYSSSALNIVPTSMNAVYRLSDPSEKTRHVLALSVLVPSQRDIEQSFDFKKEDIGYRQSFTVRDKSSRYLIGPSWGMWLSKNLSVGASLFVVYNQASNASRVLFHSDRELNGVPRDWFIFLDQSVESMLVGLMSAASIQLRFGGLRVGAQLRTPIFRLYSSSDVTDAQALVDSTGEAFGSEISEFADSRSSLSTWGFTATSPLVVNLGVGYTAPGSWRLGVDIRWDAPIPGTEVSQRIRHTVNIAVGGEVFLTDTMPLSFGVFTDFHPEKSVSDFGDTKADFYGGTIALSFISPYDVSDSEKTDRITFTTTVGIHYAYGSGSAGGLLFDYDSGKFENIERPLSAHDVHLFVGSTVRF